ncbi:uncharacterized protein A4U43_C09F5480 [Asparagus officinalis]|uniref:Uncharacterized protein n=1 Tax=Asparagus officinalis TaxID=4686 RepID=A0A5P1E8S7_ASPOF|nr:uncharacterized protein A4U43_C09F5480 [Asparagus officinalis]
MDRLQGFVRAVCSRETEERARRRMMEAGESENLVGGVKLGADGDRSRVGLRDRGHAGGRGGGGTSVWLDEEGGVSELMVARILGVELE